MNSARNPAAKTGTIIRQFNERLSRVTYEFQHARKKLTKEHVHHLRTAIRRCRTLSRALAKLRPNPRFEDLNHCVKKLFKPLGRLRDLQVMEEWYEKLSGQEDSPAMKKFFRKQNEKLQEKAEKALKKFHLHRWKKLATKFRHCDCLAPFPAGEFQNGAAALLKKIQRTHKTAKKTGKDTSYHQLRIAFKKFRYYLENFMPEIYAGIQKELERVQDFLGDYQDLTVLKAALRKLGCETPALGKKILEEKKKRLRAYDRLIKTRPVRKILRRK